MDLKEWKNQPSGTKAVRVKIYNDSGKCVDVAYILENENDTFENEYEQATEVAPGYLTETCNVTRK